MRSKFLVLGLVLLLAGVLVGAGSCGKKCQYWVKSYVGESHEILSSIQETSDGGYIAAGYTESFGARGDDAWILKLEADGDIEWQKSYGGTADEMAFSVRETADGGYIAAGYTESFGAWEGDAWILKLEADGDIEWQKSYGGNGEDVANIIRETSGGGYIVAGRTESFDAGGSDCWVLKLDADGDIQWQRCYGGTADETASSIRETADGGYIVAGHTDSLGVWEDDAWVLKLDADGNIEWQKSYGGTESDSVWSVGESSDGGYIMAGHTDSFGAGDGDIWVLKLDPSGEVEWQKCYGGADYDFAISVQESSDGGYIVAGNTLSFGAGLMDVMVLKLDPDGDIRWQQCYGYAWLDTIFGLDETADGSYVIIGSTSVYGSEGINGWILKLDPDGDIPECSVVAYSNASVEDTNVTVVATEASVTDMTVVPTDTDIEPANTDCEVETDCCSSKG